MKVALIVPKGSKYGKNPYLKAFLEQSDLVSRFYGSWEMPNLSLLTHCGPVSSGLSTRTMGRPAIYPWEALEYADTVMVGEGEELIPQFLSDFYHGEPKKFINPFIFAN